MRLFCSFFLCSLTCYVTNYFPFLRWLVSQSVESSALTAVNNCAARLWIIAAPSHPQQLILPTRGLNEIARNYCSMLVCKVNQWQALKIFANQHQTAHWWFTFQTSVPISGGLTSNKCTFSIVSFNRSPNQCFLQILWNLSRSFVDTSTAKTGKIH